MCMCLPELYTLWRSEIGNGHEESIGKHGKTSALQKIVNYDDE